MLNMWYTSKEHQPMWGWWKWRHGEARLWQLIFHVFVTALMFNVSCSLIPRGMWECTCEEETEPCEEGSDLPLSLSRSGFVIPFLHFSAAAISISLTSSEQFCCLTPPSSIWRCFFFVLGECCCTFAASPWGKSTFTSHKHTFCNY